MERPELVRRDAFKDTTQTAGIARKEAFASDGVWAGVAATEPGRVSGWHHHGDHATYLFVIAGRFHLESGPGGRDVIDAEAGDFVMIPARVVHREANPAAHESENESEIMLVRIGTGPVAVNVDGPEPD